MGLFLPEVFAACPLGPRQRKAYPRREQLPTENRSDERESGLLANGPWYGPPALSAWRTRSCGIVAGVVATLAVSACGSGANQAANEPSGKFPVAVALVAFPPLQRLAQRTHLVIAVRNAGTKPIPNVAVTICNVTCAYPAPRGEGTSSQAFSANISQPDVANPSRPLWIINRGPGPCGYSCNNGGQSAAVTAYSNTWALGRLGAGHTARFDWALTAVQAGKHVVAWEVAAGLNGKAKAVLAGGAQPQGTISVLVTTRPKRSYVNDSGQIVTAR
jgi:hypothetical protein